VTVLPGALDDVRLLLWASTTDAHITATTATAAATPAHILAGDEAGVRAGGAQAGGGGGGADGGGAEGGTGGAEPTPGRERTTGIGGGSGATPTGAAAAAVFGWRWVYSMA
jgi:hypothetical protein